MKDNADSAYVRLISVTFGDTTYDEKSANVATKEHAQMIFRTFFLIPLCLWFSQAWLQTKWLDIRITLNKETP